jgi:hypothetical protein
MKVWQMILFTQNFNAFALKNPLTSLDSETKVGI